MNSKSLVLLTISSLVLIIILSLTLLILPDVGNSIAKSLGLSSEFQTVRSSSSGIVEQVKVKRVIDGDTIELSDGRRIRYLNIDTPETVKAGTPVMCWGPEAKEFNKKSIENQDAWLLPDKENTDRFNRELRIIFLNPDDANSRDASKSLNAELIKRGMAQEKSYSPNTTYRKNFQQLELQAKNNKVGAWGNCQNPFRA